MGVIDIDDVSESATDFGARLGYSVDVGATRSAQVCPFVTASVTTFPGFSEDGISIDVSGRSFGIGGSFGFVASQSESLMLVPSLGATLLSQRFTVSASGFGEEFTESESETYTLISAGLGLVLNRRVTIQPMVAIPVGLDGADASIGVAVSFSFGPRSQ